MVKRKCEYPEKEKAYYLASSRRMLQLALGILHEKKSNKKVHQADDITCVQIKNLASN